MPVDLTHETSPSAPYTTPNHRGPLFIQMGMDLLGPLPKSAGVHEYILVIEHPLIKKLSLSAKPPLKQSRENLSFCLAQWGL